MTNSLQASYDCDYSPSIFHIIAIENQAQIYLLNVGVNLELTVHKVPRENPWNMLRLNNFFKLSSNTTARCIVGRGSWGVGRGSWVVGRGSWVVGRGL